MSLFQSCESIYIFRPMKIKTAKLISVPINLSGNEIKIKIRQTTGGLGFIFNNETFEIDMK